MKRTQCAVCKRETYQSHSRVANPCCEDHYIEFHSNEVITFQCEICHKESETTSSFQSKWCSWSCYVNRTSSDTSESYVKIFDKSSDPAWHLPNEPYINQHEFDRMNVLQRDKSIRFWCRSERKITYVDKTGVTKIYTPDFDIYYHDGSVVSEDIYGYSDEDSKLKIDTVTAKLQLENISFRVLNDRCHIPIEPAMSLYVNDYGTWKRPTFQHIFMSMASEMRNRSTCVRKQVGAVFVDTDFTRVLCFGYNGGISGDKNQCESLLPGQCGCTHAEINAMVKSNESLKNSILFVTTAPCKACAAVLINRGVSTVYYLNTYRSNAGIELLESKNIKVIKWTHFVDKAQRNNFDIIHRFTKSSSRFDI